jgi:CTP synthase
MRLGAYPCKLIAGTRAREIYGAEQISERHRHRYEVNQKYLPPLVERGLVVSGKSPDGKFVEMIELPDHPWYLGCQFHPEYKSKPIAPHPLFVSFIKAALANREARIEDDAEPRPRAVQGPGLRAVEAVRSAGAQAAAQDAEAMVEASGC